MPLDDFALPPDDLTAEALFLEESFQNWVMRSHGPDVRFWEDWIARHPQHQPAVREATRMVRLLSAGRTSASRNEERHSAVTDEQVDRAVQAIISRIDSRPATTRELWPRHGWHWPRVAATLAILLLLGGAAYRWLGPPASPYRTHRTDATSQPLRLPDGSRVVLNTHSSLRYRKAWPPDAAREVWLDGEAYFEVQPLDDPRRQFTVHANQLKVAVLGTTFNVWQRNHRTKVTLRTGRIELKGDALARPVRMVPGEMVELEDARPAYARRRVSSDLHTSWKDQRLVFDATPMDEVALLIETRYGYRVRFGDENVRKEKLTYKPVGDDFGVLLRVLEESFRVEVNHPEKQLVLRDLRRN